jgi:hypothetical protein
MTYWSRANLIWRGLGSFAAVGRAFGCSSISSSMISWQRLMHSSQMYTPCPAISFRTCSWLLPQNEHRYGTLGPLVLLVEVTPAVLSSVRSSLRATYSLAFFGLGSFVCTSAGSVTDEPSPPPSPASWAWAISESPGIV